MFIAMCVKSKIYLLDYVINMKYYTLSIFTGCNQQSMNQMKVTSVTTASVTSAVTIIRPILSTTAHTFVFSPLSLSTVCSLFFISILISFFDVLTFQIL